MKNVKRCLKKTAALLLAAVLLFALLPVAAPTAYAAGMNEKLKMGDLLRAYNLVGGQPFERAYLKSILKDTAKTDLEKPGALNIQYDSSPKWEYSTYTGHSISEYMESFMSETTLSNSTSVYGGFKASKLSTMATASYTYTNVLGNFKETSGSKETFIGTVQARRRLGVNKLGGGSVNADLLWDCLTDDFKAKLISGDIGTLFSTYGSHVLTSYALGGYADTTLAIARNSNSTTSGSSNSTANEWGANVEAKFCGFTVGASNSTTYSTAESTKSTYSTSSDTTVFKTVAHGGTVVTSADASNISSVSAYTKWADSITADNFNSTELLPDDNLQMAGVWELLPDTPQYTERRAAIRQYFFDKAMQTDTSFLNSYIYGTTSATNNDVQIFPTPNPSYTYVSTPEEMYNVRDDLYGNYVLTNDIDMSGYANWKPIDNFTGKFDGNGNTVKNVAVDPAAQWPGLFGNITGKIENLGVTYTSRFGGVHGGGVYDDGRNAGTANNCYASFQMPSSFERTYTLSNVPSTISASTVLIDFKDASTAINKTLTFNSNVKMVVLRGSSSKRYTGLKITVEGKYTDVVFENFKYTYSNGNALVFNGSGGTPSVISVGSSPNSVSTISEVMTRYSAIYGQGITKLYICGTQEFGAYINGSQRTEKLTVSSNQASSGWYGLDVGTATLDISIDALFAARGGMGVDVYVAPAGSTSTTYNRGHWGGNGGTAISAGKIIIRQNSSVAAFGGGGGAGGYLAAGLTLGASVSASKFGQKGGGGKGGDSGAPMSVMSGSNLVVSNNAYLVLQSGTPGAGGGAYYTSNYGSKGSYPSFGIYENNKNSDSYEKRETIGTDDHQHPKWDNGNNALSIVSAGRTSYVQGTTFDEGRVRVAFGTGDKKTDVTASVAYGYDFRTAGYTVVTVLYWSGGKRYVRYIPVEVTAPKVTKSEFIPPAQTEFVLGTPFNTKGMTLAVKYDDGSIKTYTSGFTVSPAGTSLMAALGKDKTVTVSHPSVSDWSTTYKVSVIEVAASALELTVPPAKGINPSTAYYEGETLSYDGAQFTVRYNNGETKKLKPTDVTFGTAEGAVLDGMTRGNEIEEREIKATYGGVSCTFKVLLRADPIVKLRVEPIYNDFGETAARDEYYVNQAFSLDGWKIYGEHAHSPEDVELTVNDVDILPSAVLTKLTTTHTKVTFRYKINTAAMFELPITVKLPTKTGIEITALPDKLRYTEGDSFKPEGMIVSALYDSGARQTLDAESYTVEPSVFGQFDSIVTVTEKATGNTASFNVELTPLTRYEVSFDLAGGYADDSGAANYEPQTIISGGYITLPAAPAHECILLDNDVSFACWENDDGNGSVTQYQPGETFAPAANTRFTAVWNLPDITEEDLAEGGELTGEDEPVSEPGEQGETEQNGEESAEQRTQNTTDESAEISSFDVTQSGSALSRGTLKAASLAGAFPQTLLASTTTRLSSGANTDSSAFRIVLEWGDEELDLDSHLITPTGDEVYWNNTAYPAGRVYSPKANGDYTRVALPEYEWVGRGNGTHSLFYDYAAEGETGAYQWDGYVERHYYSTDGNGDWNYDEESGLVTEAPNGDGNVTMEEFPIVTYVGEGNGNANVWYVEDEEGPYSPTGEFFDWYYYTPGEGDSDYVEHYIGDMPVTIDEDTFVEAENGNFTFIEPHNYHWVGRGHGLYNYGTYPQSGGGYRDTGGKHEWYDYTPGIGDYSLDIESGEYVSTTNGDYTRVEESVYEWLGIGEGEYAVGYYEVSDGTGEWADDYDYGRLHGESYAWVEYTPGYGDYNLNNKCIKIEPVALLEGNLNGYGQEVITIQTAAERSVDGVYQYSVQDWTTMSSSVSTALRDSQAVVRVYYGASDTAAYVFNVPASGDIPNVWHVFDIIVENGVGRVVPATEVAPTTYTITFNPNSGTVSPTTASTGTDGKLTTLPTPTRNGYSFNGWFTEASGGTQVTTSTVFTKNATVYAQWTFSGDDSGGGGYTPSPSPTPNPDKDTSGESGTVSVSSDNGDTTSENVRIPVTVNADGSVTLKADDAKVDEIVDVAKKTGIVTIDLSAVETGSGKVSVTEVDVPLAIAKKLSEVAGAALEIKLSQGSVTFDRSALEIVAGKTKDDAVTVIFEEAKTQLNDRQQQAVGDRPVYNISIMNGDTYITDFGGGILTISIPYTLKPGEKPANVKAYYIDDLGNIQDMNGTYDARTKSVTFSTTHLSTYYIGYSEWVNTYPDITGTEWYYDAVKYVSENDLFHGTGKGFEPNVALTRAMIVTMLYNYGKPESGTYTSVFDDVPLGQWYSDPIAWAAANGIVHGDGNGKFRPNDAITRQEMAVIFYNFAKFLGKGPIGDWAIRVDFADTDSIPDWALEAVMWNRMKGVIIGEPNPNGGAYLFNPKGVATRAMAAQMLMNYIENAIR